MCKNLPKCWKMTQKAFENWEKLDETGRKIDKKYEKDYWVKSSNNRPKITEKCRKFGQNWAISREKRWKSSKFE